MEKFVGRKKELSLLESVWEDERGKAVCVYGRRKIGKSTLLRQFCKNKRSIYVQFVQGSLEDNFHVLSIVLTEFTGEKHGPYSYISDPITEIQSLCAEARTVVVFDELPYLLDCSPSAASVLQHFADNVDRDTDSMIVICGSSISVMKKEISDYNRPMYGRFGHRMEIGPMSYSECAEFHPEMPDIDRLKLYLTVGGVPKYHLDDSTTYREFLEHRFLFPGADLKDEAENIVSAEFSTRGRYLAILNAISDGKTSLKLISDRTHLDRATCLKCLDGLREIGVVGTVHPMHNAPKRTVYEIRDSIVSFCQTVVNRNEALPLRDHAKRFDYLENTINTFLGRRFEYFCAEFIVRHRNCLEIGKWWGPDSSGTVQEIDIVATIMENDVKLSLYGECKFTSRRISMSEFRKLKERSESVKDNLTKKFILFSISGFDYDIEEYAKEWKDLTIVGPEDLTNELSRYRIFINRQMIHPSMRIEVELCQLRPVPGNPEYNAELILNRMTGDGGNVLVFPECFLTGYGVNPAGLENSVSDAIHRISDACRKLDKAVAVGTARMTERGAVNSLIFLSPDGDTVYDKTHLAKFGIYSENGFVPGNRPAIGSYHGLKFGLCICYDIYFPEILHGCSLKRADVNLCISASAVQSAPYFEKILPARALENVTYLAFVNNVGTFGNLTMAGGSTAFDPMGERIVQCPSDAEDVASFSVDTEEIVRMRGIRRHLTDFRRDVNWLE